MAVTIAAIQDFALIASDGSDYFHIIGPQRVQPGAGPMPLMEFARSSGVNAEIRHSVEIFFDEGIEVANREVIATLRWFHDHIRDAVFQRLETHF